MKGWYVDIPHWGMFSLPIWVNTIPWTNAGFEVVYYE